MINNNKEPLAPSMLDDLAAFMQKRAMQSGMTLLYTL